MIARIFHHSAKRNHIMAVCFGDLFLCSQLDHLCRLGVGSKLQVRAFHTLTVFKLCAHESIQHLIAGQ
ncbi:hypothetical protein D3C78_755270 [compost metagenome]